MQTISNTNFEQWLSYQAKQNAENKAKIIRMDATHKRVFKKSFAAKLKQFFTIANGSCSNFKLQTKQARNETKFFVLSFCHSPLTQLFVKSYNKTP